MGSAGRSQSRRGLAISGVDCGAEPVVPPHGQKSSRTTEFLFQTQQITGFDETKENEGKETEQRRKENPA